VDLFTIGFTKRSAEDFFGRLTDAGITRLVDVRLNNRSQLAGFAKRDDLRFFLRTIVGADYVHEPLLAPTQQLLDRFKQHGGDWATYEAGFRDLMAQRRIEERIPRDLFAGRSVLLCSEHEPERCHRRLVAEHLDRHWGGIDVVHL
jgi:uncharacterized protein (DUF488 family)